MSMELNKIQKIIVLTTGGTIEKTYDEFDGSLSNRESIIKQKIIQNIRLPYTELEVHSIMNKDSLDMTDEDRITIFKAITYHAKKNCPIVVLHGTDTLEKTIGFCHSQIATPTVTIVFSGAMKPLGFEDSDAKQNVVEAIFAAKTQPAGWYLAFHSTLFKAPNLRKNRSKGTFEHC